MRYDVRVADVRRFNFERAEPLSVGELVTQFTVTYKITAVYEVEDERFDGVAEVEQVGGPAEARA